MYLKKKGYDCYETVVSEYLVVLFDDPSEDLKMFHGLRVEQATDTSYSRILKDVNIIKKIRIPIAEGDPVQVNATGEKEHGATGIVEKILPGNKAIVLLTMWGLPYRTEIPIRYLKKLPKAI